MAGSRVTVYTAGGTEANRRTTYLLRLALSLTAAGMGRRRLQSLVGELDGQVARAGADPIHELGPLGEVVATHRATIGAARTAAHLAAVAVQGVAAGLVGAAGWTVLVDDGPQRFIRLAAVLYGVVLYLGTELARAFPPRGLQGAPYTEHVHRGRRGALLTVILLLSLAVAGVGWHVSLHTAQVLLALSAVASVAFTAWSWWRIRTTLPRRHR